jgi:hypothetical protein
MSPRVIVGRWKGRRLEATATAAKAAARLDLVYPGCGPGPKRNLCVELACVPGRSWR